MRAAVSGLHKALGLRAQDYTHLQGDPTVMEARVQRPSHLTPRGNLPLRPLTVHSNLCLGSSSRGMQLATLMVMNCKFVPPPQIHVLKS